MTRLVVCRAQLGDGCQGGMAVRGVYGPEEGMEDDGTWDGRSVVCNTCYVRLMPFTPSGQAQLHEIPRALALYRNAQIPVEDRVKRFTYLNEGEGMTVTREDRDDGVHLIVSDGGFPEAEAVISEGRPVRWL